MSSMNQGIEEVWFHLLVSVTLISQVSEISLEAAAVHKDILHNYIDVTLLA